MKTLKICIPVFFFIAFSFIGKAQELKQKVKGRVIDKVTRVSIPGANIAITSTDPLMGTITDIDGYFSINAVPIGRITLTISFMGYETITLHNVNLTSGKELVLLVEMEENVVKTKEVIVKANKDKTKPLNEMTTVSARTFSVEESQRYAGARNDISRMAANYAGVSTANDAENGIVIRGNSPNGLLWRMEGIDIPNPNHFGQMGATGGPVSMLNNNLLSNSDFMTAAFPAEYGNATSGVFDLKLRSGNYEKHEFLGQIGFNGFEAGVEGPLFTEYSSYLINYRYSTLGLLSEMGVSFGTGTAIPKYQDICFKIHIPTSKTGTFDFFGLAGKSSIAFEQEDDDSANENFYNENDLNIYNDNRMGVIGFNHTYIINKSTYTKFSLSATAIENQGILDSISTETGIPLDYRGRKLLNTNLAASLYLNKKFNAKHNIRIGTKAKQLSYNMIDSIWVDDYKRFRTIHDEDGSTNFYQAYLQWQYNMNDEFTLNCGVHSYLFALNNTSAVEPRLGLRWQFAPRQSLNIAYGLHSKLIPLYTYFWQVETSEETYHKPNMDLEPVKSHHYVIGYDFNFTNTLRIKAEAYYQDIFDAVTEQKESNYSMLNDGSFPFEIPDSLQNGGTGRNYGVELTFEKFMDKGLYWLVTTSLFNSKYKGSNGVERNTFFNGGYVVNLLGGKEFEIFKGGKNANTKKWLTLDGKVTFAGGQRYIPVDISASIDQQRTVYDYEMSFEKQLDDYFRADLRVAFRLDTRRTSHEFAFDVQNITNHQNPLQVRYNRNKQAEEKIYQLGFFPMVQYRVVF